MDLENQFKLSENGTTVKTEVIAGVTTFMTMAYILAVNPSILAVTGMDAGAVFTATALSSLIATLIMALHANYPFALAPAMGPNAFFAYTIVLQMGYSWQTALAAVLVEGIIFIIISATNLRESIFNAIPPSLKIAIPCGIGLFIAFIGLQNAKIVVDGATLVSLYSVKSTLDSGLFNSEGISVILAYLGVLTTAILLAKKTKGAILWGILITWGMGMVCQIAGLYVPNPAVGAYSLFPDFSTGLSIPSLAPTFMKADFSNLFSIEFIVIVIALLLVDMFDTLGTLIGIATKANMLDKDNKLPRIKNAFMADAIGTTAGAVLGTSTVSTFVESATGVSEGGRTGLTSAVVAGLFFLSLFFSPIFLAIPSFATAPALIVVGFLMLSSITKLDFEDISESLPAYITIIIMPFAYSIPEGISLGVISYVIMYTFTTKRNPNSEYKINNVMYALAIIFVLKYFLL